MTGVLIITHGYLGTYFLATINGMIGSLSRPTETLAIHREDNPEERSAAAAAAIARLDDGDGVLIVTDAFGATPSNIAIRTATGAEARVVAGINLPMLVRIYNYPQLTLDELAASAIEAGRAGVMSCPPPIGNRTQRAPMPTREFAIINKLGLHARAASKFVTVASQYEAEIKVTKDNRQISGKSIMGVMMLAAACGSRIQVTATGADAEAALDALDALVRNRFGEGQ